jgi:SAM-dependent methyltransferase
VTAVEIDPELAAALAVRLAGSNVDVISADAARAGLPGDRFSAATCFSMLHHVPSAAEQDLLFAELHRVLRPGAALIGIDSADSERMRLGHVDDVFVPLDPQTLGARLERAGFTDVTITRAGEFPLYGDQIRFDARKPAVPAGGPASAS